MWSASGEVDPHENVGETKRRPIQRIGRRPGCPPAQDWVDSSGALGRFVGRGENAARRPHPQDPPWPPPHPPPRLPTLMWRPPPHLPPAATPAAAAAGVA